MSKTPFDAVMDAIGKSGYHNHRRPLHSDIVSKGLLDDLLQRCETLAHDYSQGLVKHWLNVNAPGGRGRRLDLFIGEPDPSTGGPSLTGLRIGVENKSVMTAHRNRTSRFDDLRETLDAVLRVRQEAVMAATVLIGVADRVLNVPDRIKPRRKNDFEAAVLPRLSSGDQSLWTEFDYAVSANRPTDANRTFTQFRELPTRSPGLTHMYGYDYVALIPVHVDNVAPPSVARKNHLGVNVDAEYESMLDTLCRAYSARWHT